MKEICPINKCTGCQACVNLCSKNAITMSEDSLGFFYPEINQDLCVDCGICEKFCPVNNSIDFKYPQSCYAATVREPQELLSCASGGAATEISKWVISKGGVVYGCDGSNIRNVHHTRVDNLKDLELLKGSKYVQSAVGNIYKQVLADLKKDCPVLFIGTPCQIAGLKSFLRYKIFSNLITIDLVCHGVPSQKLLNENTSYYINDNDTAIVNFRKKDLLRSKHDAMYRIVYGWFLKTIHTRKNIEIPYTKDPYMWGFIKCLTFRKSCYSCKYAHISRCGDFTLCDFWGLGDDAGFVNGNGVSCVLVNTDNAKAVWREVSNNMLWVERDIIEALRGNGQLQAPSRIHKNYDKFVRLYPIMGLKRAVKECTNVDRLKDTIHTIKTRVKKLIRIVIK